VEQLRPKFTPLTAQDVIESGWASRVRSAIVRDGHAIRASARHEVEAQNINRPEIWQTIMLTNGGTQFDGPVECAKVIDMLEGKTPIPPPTPKTT
jgi:hypothetical protein